MTLKTSRQHLAAMKKLTLAELEDKLLEHQQLLNALLKESGILLPALLQADAGQSLSSPIFTEALKAYAEKEYALAAKSFRRAAMLGHAKAQYYLGLLFVKGQGVPASLRHGYCWLLLAAKEREPAAMQLLKSLQQSMSADLIKKATELAADRFEAIEDWKQQHL